MDEMDFGAGTATSAFTQAGESLFQYGTSVLRDNAQRDWQTKMANTAHQREVMDLRLAGLNPILSATRGGSGAAVPTGGFATGVQPGVTSAVQASRLTAAQLRLLEAQAADTYSAKALKDSQTATNDLTRQDELALMIQQRITAMQSGNLSDMQSSKINAEITNLREQLEALKLANRHSALGLARDKAESDYYSGVGKYSPYLRELEGAVNSAAQAARAGSSYRTLPEWDDYEHTETTKRGRTTTTERQRAHRRR